MLPIPRDFNLIESDLMVLKVQEDVVQEEVDLDENQDDNDNEEIILDDDQV